jgi:dipeptidyl aminopeptidase/acylaminoacyl peptidase
VPISSASATAELRANKHALRRGGRIAAGVCALLALALAGSWIAGSLIVRGSSSQVASAIAPAREVQLRASDGSTISGSYWPGRTPDAPAVLLLHGVDASRDQTAPTAAWLAAQGYAALVIDLRGHGRSATADHSFGLDEGLDALAAFDWLKRQQHGAKVAVVGISLGGAAALVGREGAVPADALVLVAVFPDIRRAIYNRIASRLTPVGGVLGEPLLSLQSLPRFGVWPSRIAPVVAIQGYRGPVFVVGGAADRSTPPAETRALYNAAAGPKALWLVPGLDHGRVTNMHDVEWHRRLGGFLDTAIGSP